MGIGFSMTEDWYRFETDRRAEVTLFTVDRRQARAGAKATRFFKKHVAARTDAKSIVLDALDRMPNIRARWPHAVWPKPTGLEAPEDELVLPALMLAAGRSEEEVERIVRSNGEPA